MIPGTHCLSFDFLKIHVWKFSIVNVNPKTFIRSVDSIVLNTGGVSLLIFLIKPD
jgi:hypothetical protein